MRIRASQLPSSHVYLPGSYFPGISTTPATLFGPGILAWQASALRAFGPGHAEIFHTWCVELQNLAELTMIYGERYRHDPPAFVRKLTPLVTKMRLSLQPLLLKRLPDRVRHTVEDSFNVTTAVELPANVRFMAMSALRFRPERDTKGDAETEEAPAPADEPKAQVKVTKAPASKKHMQHHKASRPTKRERAAARTLDAALNNSANTDSEKLSADQLRAELGLGAGAVAPLADPAAVAPPAGAANEQSLAQGQQAPKEQQPREPKEQAKAKRQATKKQEKQPARSRGGRGGQGARGGRGGRGSPRRRHRRTTRERESSVSNSINSP